VARSIDAEMKRTGAESVFLDITSQSKAFLLSHFPMIYEKCAALGIDMATQPIPVVPAAHYLCGGVLVDLNAQTDIRALFTIGESACSGLHGANRLASNSLLECVVFAHRAAQFIFDHDEELKMSELRAPAWTRTGQQNADEMVVISHMWDEIRRLMWNYVGIVRTNRRLERAQHRLRVLLDEIHKYYWDMKVHPDVLELRNLALVAHLTVECALQRHESRGIHFSLDYPPLAAESIPVAGADTVVSPESLAR
jgi:L-aspartate oxidase